MLNIIPASQPLPVGATISLLYGQPGVGKTSAASTADRPLMLDFDGGSRRSAFRCNSVQVASWPEVAGLQKKDLDGYSTLIIDTAGRAIDFLVANMPTAEGKTQLKRASGDPTLQGYGYLKTAFVSWLKRITTFGIDVVMVAHDKEDRDGDARLVRPDVMGGSYGEILKMADFVGYMYRDGNRQTILDFSPTDRWVGKNSAGLLPLAVPDFALEPAWFAGVMGQCKASLGAIVERQKEAVSSLTEFRDLAAGITTQDEIELLADQLRDWPKATKLQAWNALRKAAKGIGFEYSKDAGKWQPIAA